jgi:hypothetical protein
MHVLTGARFTDVTNYCKEADEAFAGSSGRRCGTRYCVIGSAHLQGAPRTVTLMKVGPATLATGYRASKLIGSSIANEAGETVGAQPRMR